MGLPHRGLLSKWYHGSKGEEHAGLGHVPVVPCELRLCTRNEPLGIVSEGFGSLEDMRVFG